MPRKIIVSFTALRDIESGIEYYKLQQKGLGRHFESIVQATFKKIQKFPHAASFAYEDVFTLPMPPIFK